MNISVSYRYCIQRCHVLGLSALLQIQIKSKCSLVYLKGIPDKYSLVELITFLPYGRKNLTLLFNINIMSTWEVGEAFLFV